MIRRTPSGPVFAFLCVIGVLGGCTDSPAGAVASGDTVADPAQLDADFMRAYREGFADPDAKASSERAGATQSTADAEPSSVERDFVAGYSQLTGLQVQDVAQFVASGEADALLRSRYRSGGLTQGELLSANTLLFIAFWEAYSGTHASAGQVEGLRKQMAALSTRSREFEHSPEGRRQHRLYELLAALLMREHARMQSAETSAVASFRQTVREDFLRQSGNDLARYELTADGFVER